MTIHIGLPTSISIVLCLCSSWILVESQFFSRCLSIFDTIKIYIEPKAIYSRNLNITVSADDLYTYGVASVLVNFVSKSQEVIFCDEVTQLTRINYSYMFYTCKTRSYGAFENNESLSLVFDVGCTGNVFNLNHVYHEFTVVADPDVKSFSPLFFISSHTNRISLQLESIFPSIDATFDIDIGNKGTCQKVRDDKLVVYDCFFNESLSNIFIHMNNQFWKSWNVQFVPRPEIVQIKGSTFENALIPVCFIGKNMDSFSDPVMYTKFSTDSNACNVTNKNEMCCTSAFGLEPIDEVINVEAQIYSHSFPLVNVLFRQALVPILTHTEFSFKRNQLTIQLLNFETHYSPYITIAIFDSVRRFMIDCVLVEVKLETIICNPNIKISLSGRNTHYVVLNISQWSTTYPRFDSVIEDVFSSFQLIIIVIVSFVFIMLVSWACIIIYYGCFDSVDGIRILSRSYFYRSRRGKSRSNRTDKHRERKYLSRFRDRRRRYLT